MSLVLESHDLIHREIRLGVAKFLDGGDDGTLRVCRQCAECVRVGEFGACHGNGYRADVVVVHQLSGQRTSLILGRDEQGLAKINNLGLLVFVVTLVVLDFLVLAISGIIFVVATAITAFALAVVIVTATGTLFAVLFHLVGPWMEPRNANGDPVDIAFHDDVRLVLIKVVVPLLENLFALLDAFDIVDGHLDQHGKPPMNLYGIHCTRVCVRRKSLYTPIMKSGFVSIFGKPSVGKSSLMNTILGTKLSIVSPKQQTTWYNILGILNKKDAQVCFVDTPGYHKVSKSKLNTYLVDTALQSLEDIEVVYFVIDQSAYPDAEYEEMIAIVIKLGKPIFLVVNKMDLDTAKRHEMVAAPFVEKLHPTAVFHVSAATGAGVTPLVKATIDAMPVGEPYFDDKTLTSHPIELIVADTVREQLFNRLQDELPYSTAVVTDDITESAKGIRAMVSVYVAKDSQKGMIIGKGGELIATIKDVARKNLVHFLGERVELDLRVKVEKNWNRKLLTMKHFGLVVSKK